MNDERAIRIELDALFGDIDRDQLSNLEIDNIKNGFAFLVAGKREGILTQIKAGWRLSIYLKKDDSPENYPNMEELRNGVMGIMWSEPESSDILVNHLAVALNRETENTEDAKPIDYQMGDSKTTEVEIDYAPLARKTGYYPSIHPVVLENISDDTPKELPAIDLNLTNGVLKIKGENQVFRFIHNEHNYYCHYSFEVEGLMRIEREAVRDYLLSEK